MSRERREVLAGILERWREGATPAELAGLLREFGITDEEAAQLTRAQDRERAAGQEAPR